MNNYQLYKTNVLLGGQLKWDLIINSTKNTLNVNDFHLTPISNNTSYTYKNDENLLLNSHQDNVKLYYRNNKSFFYSECLDSIFLHNQPVLCEENTLINTYCNTYDMGCKRTKHFNLYKKQFEFFCPLWLEQVSEPISFKIEVKNKANKILGSNTLVLDITDENEKFHNNFVQYFKKYINEAGLKKGNDNVINIQFNDISVVNGLNVNTGLFETKKINNLSENILSRERPLMEVDNFIITSFPDNNIICKQLFNFNLCFNLEDIFSKSICKLLYGEQLFISVKTFIGDNELELKSFDTEYDYIENNIQKYSAIDIKEKYNVLDYLQDNKYIEFINKNKFCQSICHWSLSDNNDYIFNVYEGYAGIMAEETNDGNYKIYRNKHQYKNAPNLTANIHDLENNAAGWLNIYKVNIWNDFYKYINYTDKYKTQGIHLYPNMSKYVNNIQYNIDNLSWINKNKIFDKYIIGLLVDDILLSQIIQSFNVITINNSVTLYLIKHNDILIFVTNNLNNLAFYNVYNNLNNISKIEDNDLEFLYKFMSNKIIPKTIVFNNSLFYIETVFPLQTVKVKEIEYIENNNMIYYIQRYDGKIKPTFTDKCNTLYYKDYISETKLKNSIYALYNHLNVEPLYPSINYNSIKKITNYSYDNYPMIKVSEFDNEEQPIYSNNFEYSWFNNSSCLILKDEINLIIELNFKLIENDFNSIYSIINKTIQNFYKLSNDNENLINYIHSLYEYSYNWEYKSEQEINIYKYNIKLKLKDLN